MVKVIDTETIIVNKAYFEELLNDSRFLNCLTAAGVDNWDWYEAAVEDFVSRYGGDE